MSSTSIRISHGTYKHDDESSCDSFHPSYKHTLGLGELTIDIEGNIRITCIFVSYKTVIITSGMLYFLFSVPPVRLKILLRPL